MRIQATRHLCQSYGNCVAIDPEHLDLDDEGLVMVTRDSVENGELATVQAGIRSCPVNALVLVDGE
ncbi:ferredoxin [Pseudarthrobacter phenanthrenivorans]|uniref:Ferredoxin n=1 Tax=Pseudarthrobacter phenanthrenivorans TaxID=361575 RepID=A0A3B0F5F9_PSEPS|nr:ferredoxin [Pseudarthrobacter phenanthrenivorans]RKO20404.1 ferredoxin [Pseudarthrobacter phenanthrenivorans]